MLIAEIVFLCALFFLICYLNTGSDEKNIKSFASYPDEIQHIVRQYPTLNEKIKTTAPVVSFLSNVLMFGIIILVFGFFIKQENFVDNFICLLILGQCLNAFDFLVIDMLWWRNSKRIRFTGTEDLQSVYRNSKKHFISFLKGILVFLMIAVMDGLILSFL
ncbi:hypothetical protein LQZ18_16250 [Lachnospiraceae bacterium ZAX-1]